MLCSALLVLCSLILRPFKHPVIGVQNGWVIPSTFKNIYLLCRGDYRTGKRLNMRRIISYIASNFQNDRIWLRRSKPSKRVYQILIAVDDSSSMSENDCDQVFTVEIPAPGQESSSFIFFMQMAYESLALISNSLNRLDCGQLGICRLAATNSDM